MIYVGTAAWSIPKIASELFPSEGSHLEKYSSILNAVEINSSFYKDHLSKSYKRWSESTPSDFRFSVKLNKRFTHECELEIDPDDLLRSLEDISYLQEKWGYLLLQFPAKMHFDKKKMNIFYQTIRKIYQGPIGLEPRNKSWLSSESKELVEKYNITKVFADPEMCPGLLSRDETYYRLHGSPEIYRSNYEINYLDKLFNELSGKKDDVWCIFDNTTFGYATMNAHYIMNKGGLYERRSRFYDYSTTSMYAFDEH